MRQNPICDRCGEEVVSGFANHNRTCSK
jgi:ribosomal protein S27AE